MMKLIRAELRDIYSPDVPDLAAPPFALDAPFCVPLQIDFGAQGEDGQDQFDMLVCNPSWLAERANHGILSGLHYLIVPRFNIDEIRQFLGNLAEQCVGSTWEEVARRLGKFAHWEFAESQDIDLTAQ
jgi:hypothetical protein